MSRFPTSYPSTRRRTIAVLLCGLCLAHPGPMAATAADPPRTPSRSIPARGLTNYLEYEGLDRHADAWKATAAHEILRGIPARAILTELAQQLLAAPQGAKTNNLQLPNPSGLTTPQPVGQPSRATSGNSLTGSDLVALGEFVIRQGFGFAVYDEDGEITLVIILNGLGSEESRVRFEHWVGFMLASAQGSSKIPDPIRFRNRDLYRIGAWEDADGKPDDQNPNQNGSKRWTWWFEKDDLIWITGPSEESAGAAPNPVEPRKTVAETHQARVASVIDAIEGKQPNASTHPAYLAALVEGRDLSGFEPNGLFFAESRNPLGKGVLSELRDQFEARGGLPRGNSEFDLFEAMDISRARRILGRWGFRDRSLLTDIRFEAPAPWHGLLGLLSPAGFRKDRIPPIPRGMGAFAVGAFVGSDLRATTASLGAKVDARYRESFTAFEEAIRNATSQQLRDDLSRHLGPTACLFAAPAEGKDTEDSTVASALIAIDDAAAVATALDALAARINTYYRGLQGGERAPDAGRPAIVLERLPAPDRGYRLTSPAGLIPWLSADVQPTILIGKSFVAVANNPALARAAIAAESRPEDRWEPTGSLVKVFESFPDRVGFLSVGNPRDSFWPEAIAGLPKMLAPLLGRREGSKPDGVAEAVRAFKFPKPDDLRAHLFPSVLAAVVDDRSFRVISLEALPIGCLGVESTQNFFQPGPMTIGLKFAPRR